MNQQVKRQMSRTRAVTLTATALFSVSVVALAGCAGTTGTLSASPPSTSSAAQPTIGAVSDQLLVPVDMSSVLPSLTWGSPQTIDGVAWAGSDVTTDLAGDVFTVTTNSIPNHERDAYYAVPQNGVLIPDANSSTIAEDPTRAQEMTFSIPTSPTYSNTITAAPLGSIGVMISGAVLFNPFEGDGTTVAMANNFTITQDGVTASFVDLCSGHPTPTGTYHYHANSSCVTRQVDALGEPSHVIGLALDGFPIYGAYDMSGAEITSDKLDECNGIFSATPEFPAGIYHYVLPNTTDATSSIRCFHGEVNASQIQQMPPMMDPMNEMDPMNGPPMPPMNPGNRP